MDCRNFRRSLELAVTLGSLAVFAQLAAAQTYPAKAITMLLPQPPGAGVDIILRKAIEELTPRLGQTIVVENHPGTNSVVASNLCAHAAPDGYTGCTLNVDALATNPNLFNKLPYDPEKDFRPVTSLYYILGGLFAKQSLPVNNVEELRALAVSKPGTLNWGTLGNNTVTDISRMWLVDAWKTTVAGIPYKGGPPIFTALTSGEIDMTWQGVYGALGLMKAGKVKLVAVAGKKRLPTYPNVPTMLELGWNDMPSASVWWGLLMPAGVPDAVVRRLNTEFVTVFRDSAKFTAFLDSQLIEAGVGTPEEFAALIRKDRERLGVMIRKFNIPKQ